MIFAMCAALIVVAGLLFLFWAITRTTPEEDYETEAFGDVPHVDYREGAQR